MTFTEALVGQKCRPAGQRPATSPDDYFYAVVACWLEPNTQGKLLLQCALVADSTGKTNVLSFHELEFSDLDWS
jgi:hypothetical protein